jgi:hypothetical protein
MMNALLNWPAGLWPDDHPLPRQALLSRRWNGVNGPLIYDPMGCWATIARYGDRTYCPPPRPHVRESLVFLLPSPSRLSSNLHTFYKSLS